jgi:NADPH:quinone reductase-like Zn-dependent oxidoreductase
MLSARFDRFGEPQDVLRLEELPKPMPGKGEVLVRMKARPIHPSDLLTVRGLYGLLPKLPATPGGEGAGLIEALGPDVRGFQAGQRVIPLGVPGTWQEHLVVKAERLVPIPESLAFSAAAQFVVNPFAAWVMIAEELKLAPGQWLLQTAAGSTLGRIVLQLAKRRGFQTINVVRRREQADELRALGAEEVVCTDEEDLVARVMRITGEAGVPAAIDAVGGRTGSEAARALGRRGVMLSYGLLSGEPLTIDSGRMIFKSSTVRGFWLAEWFRSVPAERLRAVSAELLGLMAEGAVAPPVEAEYPLRDIVKAVAHAERRGRHGKVLLVD